jgi:hypothetical protein
MSTQHDPYVLTIWRIPELANDMVRNWYWSFHEEELPVGPHASAQEAGQEALQCLAELDGLLEPGLASKEAHK